MIETELDEKQRLLLWRLAVSGGTAWLSEIADGLSKKQTRDSLIASRLISEEKRTRRAPGKRATRSIFITLEDRGWAWLADHMDSAIWKSKSAAEVLQGLLKQLGGYLDRKQMALGELFVASESETRPLQDALVTDSGSASNSTTKGQPVAMGSPASDQIASAYARLSSNTSHARVRLAALRQELSHLTREEVDRSLRDMAKAGTIVLNRLDNPVEISDADEAAMIRTSLGDPRHIMHMEIAAGSSV